MGYGFGIVAVSVLAEVESDYSVIAECDGRKVFHICFYPNAPSDVDFSHLRSELSEEGSSIKLDFDFELLRAPDSLVDYFSDAVAESLAEQAEIDALRAARTGDDTVYPDAHRGDVNGD